MGGVGFAFKYLYDEMKPGNLALDKENKLIFALCPLNTTGIPFTAQQVQQIGERVNNIARLFNIREGFTRQDDTLPQRLMTEPLKVKAGASVGQLISQNDLDEMLNEYYSERGWDMNGTPTKVKLKELGLK